MVEFNKKAVRPLECFKQSWYLIKDQYWLFVAICLVGLLLGSIIPLGILMGPMLCGIYLCYLRKLKGDRISFDMLFRGFDYFKQSLIATLIIVVPFFLTMFPLYLSVVLKMMPKMILAQKNPEQLRNFFIYEYLPAMGMLMAAVMIISLLAGVFLIFIYPLIVERSLSAIDAIKFATKASLHNLLGLLGLLTFNLVLSLIGMSCCYIGAIFLLPISFGAITIAYKQVFNSLEYR